jgi:UDP-N-acetylmuramoyl-L-alanyl-D-glutamate--2,6-diaminopimelate ligase
MNSLPKRLSPTQSDKGADDLNIRFSCKLSRLISGYPVIDAAGTPERDIAGVACDSRLVEKDSLFVAVPGYRHDGRQFIEDAARRGAAAILVEVPLDQLAAMNLTARGVTAMRVANCRRALAFVSAEFYRHPSRSLSLVGVTGTNGKTTVTYLMESIAEALGEPCGVIGSINYRYAGKTFKAPMTTPEAPDINGMMRAMLDAGVRRCVIEVSSHSLELHRVRGLDFSVVAFTNLTRDHLDFHGTIENYKQAKKRLFGDFTDARRVVNTDDPVGREIALEFPRNLLTTGIYKHAEIMAEQVALTERHSGFTLKTPWGSRPVRSPLLGRHNVYNMLSAAGAALHQNIPLDVVVDGLQARKCVPGRYERIDLGQDFTVAVDYAHTDDALQNILNAARAFIRNNIILVFGCGGDRDRGKRREMGRVALEGGDYSVITSDNPRSEDPLRIIEDIRQGIPHHAIEGEHYALIPNRREAIEHAIGKAGTGDIVLIAGKGHEDYQILKTETIRFDDREVATDALKKRLSLG